MRVDSASTPCRLRVGSVSMLGRDGRVSGWCRVGEHTGRRHEDCKSLQGHQGLELHVHRGVGNCRVNPTWKRGRCGSPLGHVGRATQEADAGPPGSS